MGPVCNNLRLLLSTNNCIMAAIASPAASAQSFPPATPFTDRFSLIWNHSRCWHYCVRYKPRLVSASPYLLPSSQHRRKVRTAVLLYYVLVQYSYYSYVLLRYVLYLHSTTYLTGKRGLDGNYMLYTSICSMSRSNSFGRGRPTSSLLIRSLPAARRTLVYRLECIHIFFRRFI